MNDRLPSNVDALDATASADMVSHPPTVLYLDWNLMQDLIDGEFPDFLTSIRKLQSDGLLVVPFTYEHVREALFGLAPDAARTVKLLAGLNDVSGTVLLRPGQAAPFELCDAAVIASQLWQEPETMRQFAQHQVASVAVLRGIYETVLAQMNATDNEKVAFWARFDGALAGDTDGLGMVALSALTHELLWNRRKDLDRLTGGPSALNNGTAVDAFESLDGSGAGFDGVLPSATIKNIAASDRTGKAAGINAALNVTGWWRDKGTSLRSMLLDGLHLDHALNHADLFLTRDRRFSMRAVEVGEMCGSRTQVVLFRDGMTLEVRSSPAGSLPG